MSTWEDTADRHPDEFLTMQIFGPWRINEEPELRSLCLTLLAFLSAAQEVAN